MPIFPGCYQRYYSCELYVDSSLFCILKYKTYKFCVVLHNGCSEKILLPVFSYKTHKLMNPSFAILHQYLIKKQMMIIEIYSIIIK